VRAGFCDIDGVGCVAEGDANPANPCERCDPGAAPRAWTRLGDGEACDDGDACTEADACAEGVCAGAPRSCADESACTTDGCDPATDCTHEGVDCADELACTADGCDPQTGCTHTPDDAACDDQNPCTRDSCSASTGCANEGGPLESEPCEDGDACTDGTVCSAGTCTGGVAVPKDDGNECTTDSCDPATGVSHEPRTGETCVACTFDGHDLRLVVDGRPDGWVQTSLHPTCNAAPVSVGWGPWSASDGPSFPGVLDDVLIHSVAKSPDYLYRRAHPGVPTVRFLAHTTPLPLGDGRFPFRDYRLHWGNPDAEAVPAILTGPDGATRCVGLLSPCLGYAGWWRFDEGAGLVAFDASTGRHAGSLQGAGGPPAWVAGVDGLALAFDGSDDSVDVPGVPPIPDLSPFTLEAAVAPAGSCPYSGDRARVAEREGADGGYSLALDCAERRAAAAVESDGWGWAVGSVLATGRFAALAAVSSAAVLTLHVDASPVAAAPLTDPDSTSATDFRIGANAGPRTNHFAGVIDSVRLMTRALAPDELLHYPLAVWSFGPVLDADGQPVE